MLYWSKTMEFTPTYIRSIKYNTTFMKYIQQLISGGNL